jgi:tetratricopeptide (TPR) repeat protein
VYCRTAAVAACLFTFACARRPAGPQPERLAILRFENLGADPAASDWIGRALAEIVTTQLSGAPEIYAIPATRLHAFGQSLGVRPVRAPGISSERSLALAAGANRIGYGDYAIRAGRLEARLTIEDPQTDKMTQVIAATSPADGVPAAATALARQLSQRLAPYGTRNEQALQAWINALESGDEAAATASLERAIAADPDFAPPYRMLAERKAQKQDRTGALELLDGALARGERIPAVDRAHLEFQAATLRNDSAGRQNALFAMVKLDPRDAVAWHTLGDTELGRRAYRGAVQAYQKVLEVEPEDVQAWNQLGYAAAFAGDAPMALKALKRYQSLRPAEANPLDSLGDVSLLDGRLREAEDFYTQAARKNSGFPNSPELFKAAMARLMTGDVAGADTISQQYAKAREARHDPLAESYQAEWEWLSGRRKTGYARLAAFARGAEKGPLRDASARAYGELAIWSLLLGDRGAAEQMARQSVALASPASATIAVVARFLTQPPASAPDWATRAEQLFPNSPASPVRELALAYALLLDKEFPPAALVLKKIYDRGGAPPDDSTLFLLAWALLESGSAEDVSPLLRNPIPPLTGPGSFLSFYFPRIYYLRGLAAEKQGKAQEARVSFQLFLQLSGTDPLMWAEEQTARAKLSKR